MSHATLRFSSLAEQCHTQKFYLRCFNSDFDAVREYYRNFFLMNSHLNCHRTTDIKPGMLSGVQTGNGTPHDEYNIRGIAHARTNRKDD